MIRFLHSSDLHLGKPFGRFPEDVRGILRKARADVIGRLAGVARAQGAATILLAGDTFDAETPSPQVIRQALNAMAADPGLRWIILPGNHDSLAATQLWRDMVTQGPANVTLAITADPIPLAPDAVLLPAPCTARRPGRDLTDALDQPTAPGVIRIGLAHGAVTDFAGGLAEEGGPAIIPPDRAERSGIDYLALGDWHGQMRIGPRQWYSGTPEPESFKHDRAGAALLVSLTGKGATPEVSPVDTGVLRWLSPQIDLQPGDDPAGLLGTALPGLGARVNSLVHLAPTGRLSLAAHAALSAAIDAVAPDFLSCTSDLSAMMTIQDATDLDQIDRAGALRSVADRLVTEADDQTRTAADRAVSAAALQRLFAFATETP